MARAIHLLLLGIWAGAGLYHLVVIIPEALGAFSSRQDALAFIGRWLADLDLYGVFAGPVLLLSLLAGWVRTGARWPARRWCCSLRRRCSAAACSPSPRWSALPTLAAADPARLEPSASTSPTAHHRRGHHRRAPADDLSGIDGSAATERRSSCRPVHCASTPVRRSLPDHPAAQRVEARAAGEVAAARMP
jgi:hypothetical protein